MNNTILLRPSVRAILQSDQPDLQLKKGEEVLLTRASRNGTFVKIGEASSCWKKITEFDADAGKRVMSQAARVRQDNSTPKINPANHKGQYQRAH